MALMSWWLLGGVVLAVGLLLGSGVLIVGTLLTMDRHTAQEQDDDPPAGFCA